jgi:hypothetical protein
LLINIEGSLDFLVPLNSELVPAKRLLPSHHITGKAKEEMKKGARAMWSVLVCTVCCALPSAANFPSKTTFLQLQLIKWFFVFYLLHSFQVFFHNEVQIFLI